MSKLDRNETKTVICHKCNNCGMCCRNRGDISLTPLDVLNISKYLNMYPKDFISTYCEVGEYLDVHLRAAGIFDACVFLKVNPKGKTYCDIYKVRPMACYLYPLKVVPGYMNVFMEDQAPYCAKPKKGIPVKDYVKEKSNGRYSNEFVHILEFTTALRLYYINPNGRTEQEMLEYFYYNESKEELEKKLDSFVF
ncbi:MAG: YkgJ family cysteine cluster protein [Clostridia bacterium]|nr:YkgJ family cysteine cluster protein [Clostridia bacterium]